MEESGLSLLPVCLQGQCVLCNKTMDPEVASIHFPSPKSLHSHSDPTDWKQCTGSLKWRLSHFYCASLCVLHVCPHRHVSQPPRPVRGWGGSQQLMECLADTRGEPSPNSGQPLFPCALPQRQKKLGRGFVSGAFRAGVRGSKVGEGKEKNTVTS